jgi:divalent metal cation (Fe/Co/Zn/Cd) transporter
VSDNVEQAVFFAAFAIQLAGAGLIFSMGGRFRNPLWRNLPLMAVWLAYFGFVSVLS